MIPPVYLHAWELSLKKPHGHPCRFQLLLGHELRMALRDEGRTRSGGIPGPWLRLAAEECLGVPDHRIDTGSGASNAGMSDQRSDYVCQLRAGRSEPRASDRPVPRRARSIACLPV